MSDSSLYAPKASVKIDDADIAATRIVISSQINSFPSIEVYSALTKGNNTKKDIHDISSQDVTQKLGDTQQLLYTERKKPNAQVELVANTAETDKNTILIEAYTTGVGINYSTSGAFRTDGLMPESALIDAIDFSCYNDVDIFLQVKDDTGNTAKFTGTLGTYISDIISSIADQSKIQAAISDPDIPEAVKNTYKNQHNINVKYLPDLKKLFDGYDLGWDDLKDLISDLDAENSTTAQESLGLYIKNILQAKSSNVFRNVLALCDAFNCFYAPGLRSEPQILNWSTVLNYPPEKKNFNIIQLHASSGSQDVIPTKYALVSADNTAAGTSLVHLQTKATPPITIAYPRVNVSLGAKGIHVELPPWMPNSALTAMAIYKSEQDAASVGASIGNAKSTAKSIQSDSADRYRKYAALIEPWVKCRYEKYILTNSTANMVIPLQLDIEVGQTYEVCNAKGTSLFTGLVAAVSHTFEIGNDKGQASSMIHFINVKFPGFTLPQ